MSVPQNSALQTPESQNPGAPYNTRIPPTPQQAEQVATFIQMLQAVASSPSSSLSSKSSTQSVSDSAEEKKEQQKRTRMMELGKIRQQYPVSERFSGTGKQNVRVWLALAEDQLGGITSDDTEQCYVLRGWLSDIAQQMVVNEMTRRKLHNQSELTNVELKALLIQQFDTENNRETAMLELTKLKMNKDTGTDTVMKYNQRWYSQLVYLPTEEHDGTALVSLYEQGLYPSIKEPMVRARYAAAYTTQPNKRLTLNETMQLALRVSSEERNIHRLNPQTSSAGYAHRSGNNSHSSSYSHPGNYVTPSVAVRVNHISSEANDEDDHDYGQQSTKHGEQSVNAVYQQPAASRSGPSASSSTKPTAKRTVHLSAEERDQLMRAGRCFSCYKQGHMKNACKEPAATTRPDFANLKV
ncbi:MAG: hypothetical protein JWP34_4640 [Massilia sp.]|jgi:hypothetical protein|nr:hypothetical protein [Massilia sp.]